MSEFKLTEKIQALVDKELPKMEAESLRKFIEQAQRNEEELDKALQRISNDGVVIEGLREELKKHADIDLRKERVEQREKDLKEKEQELRLKESSFELKEAQYQLNQEKQNTQRIYDLVGLLVKNPRSIEMVTTNSSIPNRDQYGNLYHDYRTEKTTSEKKETKESGDVSYLNPEQL